MFHYVGGNETDFQLKWKIVDPFLPWRKLKQTFDTKKWFCNNRCRWNVKLKSSARNLNAQKFVCSLSYDIKFKEEKEEPTAECMEIVITLNDDPINRIEVFDYPFNKETRYTFRFDMEIKEQIGCINVLGIFVHIDVKCEGIGGAHALRNGSEIDILHGGRTIDLSSLAIALEESQLHSSYCTMSMFSSENTESLVHHSILQARWTNLFTEHNLDENSSSVNTNISYSVLSNIIHYIYSTAVNICPIISDLTFAAEFFQVIWRYKLFHLYETLKQSDARVSTYTMNYVNKRRISFPLHCVLGTRLREQTFAFPVYLYPNAVNLPESSDCNFLFVIHLRYENSGGSWLSYSMMLRNSIPFHVQVTLQIPGLIFVDFREYNFLGKQKVVSGPILFLGSRETLRHTQNQDCEISERLIFGLTFTDDTSNVSIWHLSNPGDVERKRLEILSMHMRDVLQRQFKTDLVVQPLSNGCVVPSYRVHKAIFNARLPGWRNVVQPRLSEDAALPDTVMLPLSNLSCLRVISYMYTGEMFYASSELREEILRFAFDSHFESLQILIYLMNKSDS